MHQPYRTMKVSRLTQLIELQGAPLCGEGVYAKAGSIPGLFSFYDLTKG